MATRGVNVDGCLSGCRSVGRSVGDVGKVQAVAAVASAADSNMVRELLSGYARSVEGLCSLVCV